MQPDYNLIYTVEERDDHREGAFEQQHGIEHVFEHAVRADRSGPRVGDGGQHEHGDDDEQHESDRTHAVGRGEASLVRTQQRK